MLKDVVIAETDSAVSSLPSEHTTSSVYNDGPPRMITIPNSPYERKQAFLFSSTTPFAQLCFNAADSTLVAVMEPTRLRNQVLMATETTHESPPSMDASNTVATRSSTSSSSSSITLATTMSLSTLTQGKVVLNDQENMPFVLGMTSSYNDEEENCLYLLHECGEHMPPSFWKTARGTSAAAVGCTKALGRFRPRLRKQGRRLPKPPRPPRRPALRPKQQGYSRIPSESPGRKSKAGFQSLPLYD